MKKSIAAAIAARTERSPEPEPIAEPERKKRGGKIGPAANFAIVEAADANDVLFGERSRKNSPYLAALQQLIAKGPGHVLTFDRLPCRGQIATQAKKHGIKVLFGEKGSRLYVKIYGPGTPEALLVDFLEKNGPADLMSIEAMFRAKGLAAIDTGDILRRLSQNSKIALQTILGVKKWVASKVRT